MRSSPSIVLALSISLALAGAGAAMAGCTRMHAYRLDRTTEPILVTSSSLASDTYAPVAFLKVVRWRFDPGSFFKRDYESPVGFQVLNDFLVKKAVALGADAVVDVRSGYGGGLLFAHGWMEGMAVKRDGPVSTPAARPMPPLIVEPPAPVPAPLPGPRTDGAPPASRAPDGLPAYLFSL